MKNPKNSSIKSLGHTGVLLTNTGSPDAPSPFSVMSYLARFLSDRRVINLPPWLWYPILFGGILPLRARRSARMYQKIWQKEGSPLHLYSHRIAKNLSDSLGIPVATGMHYGHPSVPAALNTLGQQDIQSLVILPLYPQYSATTSAAALDLTMGALRQWRNIPCLRFIKDYADHPLYIDALCQRIREYWQRAGKKFLLFSFHGIPENHARKGDPYPDRCRLTTARVVEQLGLSEQEYVLCFQSRFGVARWLAPSTRQTLQNLPAQGIRELQVICPGFAADCLETLEEIALSAKKCFLAAGGTALDYIPALNDHPDHIALLRALVLGGKNPASILTP